MSDSQVDSGVHFRHLKVCMLAYTFYENDGRVIRYAETLAGNGADVEVIL